MKVRDFVAWLEAYGPDGEIVFTSKDERILYPPAMVRYGAGVVYVMFDPKEGKLASTNPTFPEGWR